MTKSVLALALEPANGAADDNAPVVAGGAQFKPIPIANLVNTMGHQINRMSIETISNVPECDAMLNRTPLSHVRAPLKQRWFDTPVGVV